MINLSSFEVKLKLMLTTINHYINYAKKVMVLVENRYLLVFFLKHKNNFINVSKTRKT